MVHLHCHSLKGGWPTRTGPDLALQIEKSVIWYEMEGIVAYYQKEGPRWSKRTPGYDALVSTGDPISLISEIRFY